MTPAIVRHIKRSPVTVAVYNRLLKTQCRNVRAYIFVANPGRSGSTSLSEIFRAARNAVCVHEPHPVMFNDYPPGTDREAYFRDLFLKLKRIYIQRTARGHDYYIETNHQFIKNFAEPAIQYFGERIMIIHLVRDPVSVAASFYLINSTPGTTSRGKYYLADPMEKTNLVQIADLLYGTETFSHDLYKCLWYWYEVETRTRHVKEAHPEVNYYRIQTDELNNLSRLVDMFETLGIVYDRESLASLAGTRSNDRSAEKRQAVDMDMLTEMNERLVSAMEERYGTGFWVS